MPVGGERVRCGAGARRGQRAVHAEHMGGVPQRRDGLVDPRAHGGQRCARIVQDDGRAQAAAGGPVRGQDLQALVGPGAGQRDVVGVPPAEGALGGPQPDHGDQPDGQDDGPVAGAGLAQPPQPARSRHARSVRCQDVVRTWSGSGRGSLHTATGEHQDSLVPPPPGHYAASPARAPASDPRTPGRALACLTTGNARRTVDPRSAAPLRVRHPGSRWIPDLPAVRPLGGPVLDTRPGGEFPGPGPCRAAHRLAYPSQRHGRKRPWRQARRPTLHRSGVRDQSYDTHDARRLTGHLPTGGTGWSPSPSSSSSLSQPHRGGKQVATAALGVPAVALSVTAGSSPSTCVADQEAVPSGRILSPAICGVLPHSANRVALVPPVASGCRAA